MTPQRRRRGAGYIVILTALLVFLVINAGKNLGGDRTVTLATNEFVNAVKEDRVVEVTYKIEDRSLKGKYYTFDISGDRIQWP